MLLVNKDMIDFLYGIPRSLKDRKKPYKLIYKLNKLIAVAVFPIVASFQKHIGIDDSSDVIISLTTFPARINTVWITIATLLNQKVKPGKIQLYLAEAQFPNGEKDLPDKLLKLKKRGLEIYFCDDLKPHKKYYYAIKNNPDKIIITVDDDMLYPESMTEELLEGHKNYPNTVICEYAHKIAFKKDGSLEEYRNWPSCYGDSTEPDMSILPVGCGGVLYPPKCLDDNVFNKEDIKELCIMTDDLWLKFMEAKNGTKAAICKTGSQIYFDMTGTRKSGLQHINCGQNQNDESVVRILKKYPEILEKLKS